MIADFEFYVKKGEVKISEKDVNLANSLLKTAELRIKTIENLDFYNFKIEFAYEALIEITDALLALEGFKSYSHKANVAYLRKLNFSEDIILKFDRLRELRHKSKYYGVEINEELAEEYLKFALELFNELKTILKNKLKGDKNE